MRYDGGLQLVGCGRKSSAVPKSTSVLPNAFDNLPFTESLELL